MLCGLLDPTGGEVQLAGEAAACDSEVRQRIGYMSQKFSLYDDLPIDENLDVFRRRLRGARRTSATRRCAGCSRFPASKDKENQLVGQPAGRLEAACRVRRGDHARAERALSGRADLRRRSARAPRVLADDQPARRRRRRDPGDDPLPRRGRAVQSPRA